MKTVALVVLAWFGGMAVGMLSMQGYESSVWLNAANFLAVVALTTIARVVDGR